MAAEASIESSFQAWLAAVLPVTPPPGVLAYNFNLAEAGCWIVEVIGSSTYDPGNSDWACPPEAWSSRPSEYQIECNVAPDWQTALDLVAGQVAKFLRNSQQPGARVLKSARAVCAGFVDGELKKIWPEQSV